MHVYTQHILTVRLATDCTHWSGFAQVLENLESSGIWKVCENTGIFVEVLESPGIWTYRSIFLIISIQEFSYYTSSQTWVHFLHVKSSWIHWKGPWIWHWKVLESQMSKCVWTLCMHPDNVLQRMFHSAVKEFCLIISCTNTCTHFNLPPHTLNLSTSVK